MTTCHIDVNDYRSKWLKYTITSTDNKGCINIHTKIQDCSIYLYLYVAKISSLTINQKIGLFKLEHCIPGSSIIPGYPKHPRIQSTMYSGIRDNPSISWAFQDQGPSLDTKYMYSRIRDHSGISRAFRDSKYSGIRYCPRHVQSVAVLDKRCLLLHTKAEKNQHEIFILFSFLSSFLFLAYSLKL